MHYRDDPLGDSLYGQDPLQDLVVRVKFSVNKVSGPMEGAQEYRNFGSLHFSVTQKKSFNYFVYNIADVSQQGNKRDCFQSYLNFFIMSRHSVQNTGRNEHLCCQKGVLDLAVGGQNILFLPLSFISFAKKVTRRLMFYFWVLLISKNCTVFENYSKCRI